MSYSPGVWVGRLDPLLHSKGRLTAPGWKTLRDPAPLPRGPLGPDCFPVILLFGPWELTLMLRLDFKAVLQL